MASGPDKTTVLKNLMGMNKRVIRNYITLDELVAVYPSLKEKALSTPSALTDEERRLFLDLPDVDTETANIRAVTALSHAELIEEAVKDASSLTQEEMILLKDRFWTPTTRAEHEVISQHILKAETTLEGEEGDIYQEALLPAYLPNERKAFTAGILEWIRRPARAIELQATAIAEAALPDAPEWIRRLYREGKQTWGFVVLYDEAMQGLDEDTLDHFKRSYEGYIKFALSYNGSKDIIDKKWRMIPFNAPASVVVDGTGTALDASESYSQEDGVVLRSAFRDILQNPVQYEQRADVVPITYFGESRQLDYYKAKLVTPGILANTFLVFDRICMDSILKSNHSIESMRIRAFEADYPVPGKTYAEGYQGYTWVRLDQLVTNFYELRSTKADEVGMDEIWQAAQQSQNTAFVSMDSNEAGNWTPSKPMGGFFPDSVLGKRMYAKK
jgi:hypothetical protein